MARALAEAGANLVVCDINEASLAAARAAVEETGAECLTVRCDVSDSAAVQRMFAQAAERFGTVHILVNNAALTPNRQDDDVRRNRHYTYLTTPVPRQSLEFTSNITDEEWHRWWGVNVHGTFYCTREALKLMQPQKYGRIINVASLSGMSGLSAHSPHYSATKGAVIAFSKAVAAEVAGSNISRECDGAGPCPYAGGRRDPADDGRGRPQSLLAARALRTDGHPRRVRRHGRAPGGRALPGRTGHLAQRRHVDLSTRQNPETAMEQVKVMKGIARAKGRASGEALVSELRFGWGYNTVTNEGGIIGAYENPLNGQCVKGKIVVYPTVSGTTLGSVGLYYKCQVSKVGPTGIICRNVHDIDIAGAIAGEIPAVDCLDGDPLQEIRTGDWVEIRADEVGKEATVTITRKASSSSRTSSAARSVAAGQTPAARDADEPTIGS